jgi:small subunit ribosomal protein S6
MKYELTFLLNDKEEIKNLKDLVVAQKGKVVKEEDWGEKTLSYRIKNNDKAHFYNYTIEIEKKSVTELRKKLNFNERLLRYLLLVSE